MSQACRILSIKKCHFPSNDGNLQAQREKSTVPRRLFISLLIFVAEIVKPLQLLDDNFLINRTEPTYFFSISRISCFEMSEEILRKCEALTTCKMGGFSNFIYSGIIIFHKRNVGAFLNDFCVHLNSWIPNYLHIDHIIY